MKSSSPPSDNPRAPRATRTPRRAAPAKVAAASTGPGQSGSARPSALIRDQNHRLLLNLIWKDRTISRAEIARRTGLSRSTVSDIVDDLVATKLVGFTGAGDSLGGRRPIMLGFEDDALTIVGVDIGATHVAVATTNLRCEVRAWVNRPHAVRDDPEGTLRLVTELVREVLAKHRTPHSQVVGVGVAVPSPVDPKTPGRLSKLALPGWVGVDVPARLEASLGLRVLIENDANLGALAELWWGAGQSAKDLAYVKIGTGIGSGHILGGHIYRGATGAAGEIGHLAVDPNGPPCVCGLDGCLATLVGSEVLVAQARQHLAAGRPSSLDPRRLSVDTLVTAALADDAVAREVIERAGRNLGVAIASLLNLLNPATVVLGGGLTRAGDVLLQPLLQTVRRRATWLALDDARIVMSDLGEREVAIGAATLVLQAALEAPATFPAVANTRKSR